MSKYLSIACVILAVWSVFIWNRLTNAEKEIGGLQAERTALIQTVEEYRHAEVEANKTIKKLKEKASRDKEASAWYNTNIPLALRDELQKRHNRNKN